MLQKEATMSYDMSYDYDPLPDNLAAQKAALLQGMAVDNVDQIQIEYSGSGDDGQIDDVTINSNVVNRRTDLDFFFCEEKTVRKASVYFTYELLEHYWGGWENNEGARGEITINRESGTIEWDHCEYIQDTKDYHAEL